MKNLKIILLIVLLTVVSSVDGALYGPEKEKEVLLRLEEMLELQNHLYDTLPEGSSRLKAFHKLDKMMLFSQTERYGVISKMVENNFLLNLYPKIVTFLREDFNVKGWGKPFLSHIKFSEPLEKYIVDEVPTKDAHIDKRSSECVISDVYETLEGIKHFDQLFETFVYRLSSRSGIMVIRGSYVFVDFDLNGIPDEVFFMRNYRDEHKKYWSYMLLLEEGEDALQGTSYQARYVDSLFLVLDYIVDNYPIHVPQQQKPQQIEANLF